jgi:hypothetical protein
LRFAAEGTLVKMNSSQKQPVVGLERSQIGTAEFPPGFTHLKKNENTHFTRMNTAPKTGYAHF